MAGLIGDERVMRRRQLRIGTEHGVSADYGEVDALLRLILGIRREAGAARQPQDGPWQGNV